ncbi:hypothetical protein D3C73_529920 [compost metagenome]
MMKKYYLLTIICFTLVLGLGSSPDLAKADGMGGACSHCTGNTLDLTMAKEGYIILGHNPGSIYGTYTHAMLVYQVDSSMPSYGYAIDSNDYRGNSSIAIVDLDYTKRIHDEATMMKHKTADLSQHSTYAGKAEYYRINANAKYDWSAPLHQNWAWYCSKLIYRVTKETGTPLYAGSTGTGSFAVPWTSPQYYIYVPDDIYNHSDTTIVTTTVGNGQNGLLSSEKPTGNGEILKSRQLDSMKQLYSYTAELVAAEKLPTESLAEAKTYIKQVLKDHKEQLKRIENESNSMKFNRSIYGELNFNKLTKDVDDFLVGL